LGFFSFAHNKVEVEEEEEEEEEEEQQRGGRYCASSVMQGLQGHRLT
jgi:hypothetical protein